MKILIILVITIVFLSGCAVKSTKTIQTNERLVVSLSSSDTDQYKLINQYGRVISRDSGEDKELSFRIPYSADLNQCYSISNSKGKHLSDNMYRLSLVNEYRTIDQYKKNLEKLLKKSSDKNKRYNRNLESTKNNLNTNRAFSNRSCHVPKEKPWPRKPHTKCNSHTECLEDGGAICYSRFMGLEGCSLALKELKVSGMLSSPGCAAVAAEIAGEKYDMDDAFVDFLHGVADDVGGDLMKSDSVWDNLLGVLVVGANYGIKLDKARQCTNNFVETHFGPKRRWIQTVNEIRAEPKKTTSRCVSLIRDHNKYVEEIAKSSEQIKKLSAKVLDIAAVHENVFRKQIVSPKCISVSDEKNPLVVNGVKRYLIGANIENYIPENKKNSIGIKITSLVDGMPAKLSGLHKGDVIVRINGNRVKDSSTMVREIQSLGHNTLTFSFLRGNVEKILDIKPRSKSISLVNY